MKQLLMMCALLFVLCIGSGGCQSTPSAEKPLYPIRRARGKYTVLFMRYYDDPGRNMSAVALANQVAQNFRDGGNEVYVVKTKNGAFVCLGSFNEPEGNEAKRTLELASRLVPASKVKQRSRILTPGGERAVERTRTFEPKVLEIEYLKKLEASKPGEAVIKIIKEERPEGE